MALKNVMMVFLLFLFGSVAKGDQLKVVFLGESSSKDDVWLYRVECMRKAANEMDIEFKFDFAEGDYAHHAKMIEEEAALGAHAIIGPWWDSSVYNHAIETAIKKGVFIYGLLGAEPRHTLPDDIAAKFGWAETNWFEFGRQLAITALDYIPEDSKILWPAEISTSNYITNAIDGFRNYYSEKGLSANIEVLEVGFDRGTAASLIGRYLNADRDIAAIITSGAIAIAAANIAVKELSLTPGDIALFGQVVSSEAIQGISEGFMRAGVNLELTDSSCSALRDVYAAVKLGTIPQSGFEDFLTVTKDNLGMVIPKMLQEPIRNVERKR